MPTKQSLLNQLSAFDVATLQRLVNLAPLIVLPEEDTLVNVTQEQMVAKAHALADIHFPEWTDRSSADFGQFLVELFGLFSEKDFWYINAYANEGYLQKATLYSNVYLRSRVLGYVPILYVAPQGDVQLTVAAGNEQQIVSGDLVVSEGTTGNVYSNIEPYNFPANTQVSTFNLKFAQGVYITDTVKYNGRSMRIANTKIDISTLEIRKDNVLWYQVDTFADSIASDRHYLVIPEEDGSVEIFFGKNGYGVTPNPGDFFTVKYLYGGGADGNIAAPASLQLDKYPSGGRTFSLPVHLSDFTGGSDAESIDVVRHKASINYSIQAGVINASDAITYLVNTYASIGNAYAYTWANLMYIYLIPSDGTVATQTFLDTIAAELQQVSAALFYVNGVITVYIPVTIDITVYYLTGFDPALIQAEIESYLIAYTDPLQLGQYGKDFSLSTVAQDIIEEVAGVQNVVFNLVNGTTPADVTVNPQQIIQKMTTGDMTIALQPI